MKHTVEYWPADEGRVGFTWVLAFAASHFHAMQLQSPWLTNGKTVEELTPCDDRDPGIDCHKVVDESGVSVWFQERLRGVN